MASGSSSDPAPPAFPPPVDPAVACPAQPAAHLTGNSAGVTYAYICAVEPRSVQGDGLWSFTVVRRATGGLDALLAAYGAPDESSRGQGIVACTSDLPNPLIVYLHDDTGTRAVRAPVDGCDHPTQEADAAYQALVTVAVGERQDAQVQSQLSVDSGCPDTYKDVLALDEEYPSGATTPSSAPTPLSDPVSVCTYRVALDVDGDRIGHLEAHRTLTSDQLGAVNAALAQARPDPGCSRHEQTAFALLGMGGSGEIVVALDGCAVSQGDGWWRAGEDLRTAVGG